MIFKHTRRLSVEIDGYIKYISVVSATIDHVYPFTVPTASIVVPAGNELYDYISDVGFDAIVRLQVSTTYSNTEKEVFIDVFEGRVVNVQSQFGDTTASLICVGHAHETAYTILVELVSQVDSGDVGGLLFTLNSLLYRTQFMLLEDVDYFSWVYNAEANKKYIKDVMTDIEAASGYTYYFDTQTTYNANQTLKDVNIVFAPIPSTVTNSYAVIQGNPWLLSANFTVTGDNLYNDIWYYGGTNSVQSQYVGHYTDATSAAKYNTRTLVGTDNNFNSNAICTQFSTNMIPYTKDLKITGEVTLQGIENVRICDYVHVKIGNIDVQGASLDAYMHVVRYTQNLAENEYTTNLQFGKVQKSPSDYIAEFKNNNGKISKQFII